MVSEGVFQIKLAFLKEMCAIMHTQYNYVVIGDEVSYRGKDPFSISGNLKFEITRIFERRVLLWLMVS